MLGGAEYSEATAEILDKEIKEIVSEQYERALEILRGRRSVLDQGAAVLLEKEKIDGEYLRALMDTEAREIPEKASAENVQ